MSRAILFGTISVAGVRRWVVALITLGSVALALATAIPFPLNNLLENVVDEHEPRLVPATADEIMSHVASRKARVHVLNFWATWCAPCVEEFPDFVSLADEFESSDVSVDFVSVDFPEDSVSVLAFLERIGWDKASFLKVGKDHEFVAAFETPWTGAVPATMLFEHGTQTGFVAGKTNFNTLKARIDEALAVH